LRDVEGDWQRRLGIIDWLRLSGYLKSVDKLTEAWKDCPPLYQLDWDVVHRNLSVQPPVPFKPLSSVASDESVANPGRPLGD